MLVYTDFSQCENAIAEDEHIYASLPEEEEGEEEDDTKQSGSFSARSTLPDNCQLISYQSKEDNFVNCDFKKKIDFELFKMKSSRHQSSDNSSNSSSSDQPSDSKLYLNNTAGNSNTNTVEKNDDIYEEVLHLISSPMTCEFNQLQMKNSASLDTLTGDIDQNKQYQDTNLDRDAKNEDDNDDDDDDYDDDEDEDDNINEDEISMLSEESSSTFSSFTTCANQDFEFISSQKIDNSTSNQEQAINNETQDYTLKRSVKPKSEDSIGKFVNKADNSIINIDAVSVSGTVQEIEPSTLSMAAIYYNKYILNQSGQAKSGLRQRPKINRRQSFSTAYELRQRILVNQLNLQRERLENENNKMSLIEEEAEQSLNVNHGLIDDSNHEYRGLSENLDDILQFKVSRRISTSEDNLLSIISTVANYGDVEHDCQMTEAIQSSENKINQIQEEYSPKSESLTETNKSKTFIKKDRLPGKHFTKKPIIKRPVNSAIPRASKAMNRLNEPLFNKTISHQTKNYRTANISFKELKSKKLQATKQQLFDGIKTRSKSRSINGDRICELGSLWNRSNVGNSNSQVKPVNVNLLSNKCTNRLAMNGKSTSLTSSTSSSSPPSSPSSRVPTFIPERSPRDLSRPTVNFISKLTPPSQYTVKAKQNARQNAILAKNALMLSTNNSEVNEH